MTNKEKIDILSDMTIIIDSREKKNQHIIDYLVNNKIPYKIETLSSADYSFILTNYPKLNFDKKILVERKGSLDEVAGNFTKNRDRFKREFERLSSDQTIHIVMETATWKKIINGSYRSKFSPNAYIASLLTWNIKYNCPIWFVEKKEAGEIIYKILYYELYNKL